MKFSMMEFPEPTEGEAPHPYNDWTPCQRLPMRTLAVLPSRFQASRFPGKPLALIAGRPMIQWAWEAAAGAAGVDAVVVATDDARIRPRWRGSAAGWP